MEPYTNEGILPAYARSGAHPRRPGPGSTSSFLPPPPPPQPQHNPAQAIMLRHLEQPPTRQFQGVIGSWPQAQACWQQYVLLRNQDADSRTAVPAPAADFPEGDPLAQKELVRQLYEAIVDIDDVLDKRRVARPRTRRLPKEDGAAAGRKSRKGAEENGDRAHAPETEGGHEDERRNNGGDGVGGSYTVQQPRQRTGAPPPPPQPQQQDLDEERPYMFIQGTHVKRVMQLAPIEVEMIAWKLLFAARDAQNGIVNIPKWSEITKDWEYSQYDSFGERFRDLVQTCRRSKASVNGLLVCPFETRLVCRPAAELERKKHNMEINNKRNMEIKVGKRLIDDGTVVVNDEGIEIRNSREQVSPEDGQDGNVEDNDQRASKKRKIQSIQMATIARQPPWDLTTPQQVQQQPEQQPGQSSQPWQQQQPVDFGWRGPGNAPFMGMSQQFEDNRYPPDAREQATAAGNGYTGYQHSLQHQQQLGSNATQELSNSRPPLMLDAQQDQALLFAHPPQNFIHGFYDGNLGGSNLLSPGMTANPGNNDNSASSWAELGLHATDGAFDPATITWNSSLTMISNPIPTTAGAGPSLGRTIPVPTNNARTGTRQAVYPTHMSLGSSANGGRAGESFQPGTISLRRLESILQGDEDHDADGEDNDVEGDEEEL